MNQKSGFLTKRIALWIMAALLLVFVVAVVVVRLIFPQQEPLATTGEYTVNSILYTYTDYRRIETYSSIGEPRKVNVEFWYPENVDSMFPLVIFSHGALGTRSSNLSLYRELASHGYVVGALDHPYQAFLSRDDTGKLTFLNLGYLADLQREDAKTDKQQSLEFYQLWMEIRMGDINLVLDTIFETVDNDEVGVYSLMDTANIGVMGHSLGGAAALGIGRQRDDVKAIIALEAPFMYDIVSVENDEFVFVDAVYPTPVLNIYSDDSWENLSEWAQYARNFSLLSDSAATAFNAHISSVGHLALTDLALSSPFLVRLLDRTPTTRDSTEVLHLINGLSLEFFDHFLKNQGEFAGHQSDYDY
jgi:predicted dienelactone hydrolase